MTNRILLVDDEANIIKILAKHFEAKGFSVSVAVDGEEALKKAQTGNPDLIILDIMLPKIDGFEVCRRLKQDPNSQKIPIIMLTAKTLKKDEAYGLSLGAAAYVRKPFKFQELLEQVKLFLPTKTSNEVAI